MPEPPSLAARREAFSAWIRRVLAHARVTQGLSVPKIAELAGIGNPTIYRWRDGNWRRSPQPEQLVAFCDAVGISPLPAFEILWPSKHAPRRPEPEPLDMPPALREIAKKLMDPNVPEYEKYHIRQTLQALADRPTAPVGRVLRRRGAGSA